MLEAEACLEVKPLDEGSHYFLSLYGIHNSCIALLATLDFITVNLIFTKSQGGEQLTTEIMRTMKERPGNHRSLKALFSSLPGPLAVALKVITLQNSLAVIARQHACTPNSRVSPAY